MPNLVLIPSHRRPEFLAATLRCIEKARGASDQRYFISLDNAGRDAVLDEVIASFKFLPATTVIRRQHNYRGTTYNVLEGLRDLMRESARMRGVEYVHVLDDNLLVAEDYFEFHDDAHDLDDEAAFVSGCLNRHVDARWLKAPPDDATAVYRHVGFQRAGTSLSRWFLPIVIEHAVKGYYDAQVAYCEMKLPDDGLTARDADADGLVRRLVRKHVRWGMYPTLARAVSMGDYELEGSWREAAHELIALYADQTITGSDLAFRGITTCDLIRPRAQLKLV